MKRDMDLVRAILLAVEEGKRKFTDGEPVEGSDANPEAVRYHLQLLEQAGLINVLSKPLSGDMYLSGMTWEGHEFLDTLRDPTVWAKTKDAASKVGSVGFGFLVEIGKSIAKAELQKRGLLP